MKDKATRKKEAIERDAAYKTLTTPQKVLKLDLKLGGNLGAKRQRKKLTSKILEESNPTFTPTPRVGKQKEAGKPYQKPKNN